MAHGYYGTNVLITRIPNIDSIVFRKHLSQNVVKLILMTLNKKMKKEWVKVINCCKVNTSLILVSSLVFKIAYRKISDYNQNDSL